MRPEDHRVIMSQNVVCRLKGSSAHIGLVDVFLIFAHL